MDLTAASRRHDVARQYLAALVPTTSFEVREVARDGTVSWTPGPLLSARSHIALGLRIVSLREIHRSYGE